MFECSNVLLGVLFQCSVYVRYTMCVCVWKPDEWMVGCGVHAGVCVFFFCDWSICDVLICITKVSGRPGSFGQACLAVGVCVLTVSLCSIVI